MRNPGGFIFISEPDKPVVEHETFTCCHCNKVVIVPHKCDPINLGGFCTLCMGHTCPECAQKPCIPFEKKLEALEARGKLLRRISDG